ncbi:MAG: SRPBCC domain-containing protein [Reichenbachiella sp.]|uniref:SRPBCC family protein n=1 Tax=Reichenbachiella sp. TaxID=2184521 RepID=UPI0032630A44
MNETIFTEYPEGNKLLITRKFDGPLPLVWRAWTEAELLDRWWAPEPWKSITKSMIFKEGGSRLYCMQGPNGEAHWGITEYSKILPQNSFEAKDAFCDENGQINAEIPSSQWRVEFSKVDDGTLVSAMNTFASKEAMEQLVAMGVKEGTVAVHKNLDQLINDIIQ